MIHKYDVELDGNGYMVGFSISDTGDYEFDGSLLELHYLQAYKIVDGQPWLDEERKAEIIAEEEAEAQKPTPLDIIEAQATYTALMTDTLLEE